MEQGSTFICAKGDETWLPQTVSASATSQLAQWAHSHQISLV